MKKLAFLFVLMSGILWGCMGLFVRTLNAAGLQTMDIVFLRAVVTAVVMVVYLFLFNRNLLVIHLKDIWCFLGTGIASITFFNYCYFKCIEEASLSIAAVLLYTAPAIVMVLSYVLFREKLTGRKIISLIMTIGGCILVTGVFEETQIINANGILLGLGAGLGYALYSIFSRYALERGYHSLTITCYTFIVASLSTVFLTDGKMVASVAFSSGAMFLFSLAFGIVCTVVPYLLYTQGLGYMDNSKASIIASVEPVTATVLGVLVFHEKLSFTGVCGIVLVIGALALCSYHASFAAQKGGI
jgi:transporter